MPNRLLSCYVSSKSVIKHENTDCSSILSSGSGTASKPQYPAITDNLFVLYRAMPVHRLPGCQGNNTTLTLLGLGYIYTMTDLAIFTLESLTFFVCRHVIINIIMYSIHLVILVESCFSRSVSKQIMQYFVLLFTSL